MPPVMLFPPIKGACYLVKSQPEHRTVWDGHHLFFEGRSAEGLLLFTDAARSYRYTDEEFAMQSGSSRGLACENRTDIG
jgi:hypothetical protein